MIVRCESARIATGVTHPGAIESLAAIRADRGNEHGADCSRQPRQVRNPAPQDDDAMPWQRAKLLGVLKRDGSSAARRRLS